MNLNIKEIDAKTVSGKWACVDLFSGAGGLSIGFALSGGIPMAAIDNDKDSIETYKSIFPYSHEVVCGNIQDWNPPEYLKGISVVAGGPPCQGFSLARGMRFVDDPRNKLYKEFIRVVKDLQPEWVVMENVNGITSIGKGEVLNQIYEDFKEAGYILNHRLINMADFGVPQKRKRVIFVGNRDGKMFKWPTPSHFDTKKKNFIPTQDQKPYVTIWEALSDLPWPMGNFFAHRANSKMRGPRNRDVKTDQAFTLRTRGDEFAFCENPAESAFIPEPLPEIDFFYRPISSDYQQMMRVPAPEWIKLNKYKVVEKKVKILKRTRRLAMREQARLQGFPDWFNPVGSKYSQFRQIGNAVPPVFAKVLFDSIRIQSQYLSPNGPKPFQLAEAKMP